VVKIHSLQDLKQVQHPAGGAAAAGRASADALGARPSGVCRPSRTCSSARRGKVQPLRHRPRASLAPDQPAPIPVQQQLDEQRVLQESISDEFDASTLLDVDDAELSAPGHRHRRDSQTAPRGLEHSAPNRPARPAPRRRPRGPERVHARGPQTRAALRARGARQGVGLAGQGPVLKGRVQSWLVQKNEVLAFVQAVRPRAAPVRWWCC
jgi:hypothetical protein